MAPVDIAINLPLRQLDSQKKTAREIIAGCALSFRLTLAITESIGLSVLGTSTTAPGIGSRSTVGRWGSSNSDSKNH